MICFIHVYFKKMFMEQEERLSEIRETMDHRIRSKMSENIVQAPLRISLLPTDSPLKKSAKLNENESLSPETEETMKKLANDVSSLKQKLLKARSAVIGTKDIKNIIINGTIQVLGNTNIGHLKVKSVNGENIKALMDDCVR